MKVKLLTTTPHALDLLIFTKESRLDGSYSLADVIQQPIEWKMEQLDYMLKTIKGAFEFVHYTFQISEVTRAFTHQLVRTRTASYQQESLRAVQKSESNVLVPESDPHGVFANAANMAFGTYEHLINSGMQIQDARGILPIATKTNIMMKINLRNLSEMAKLRLCTRTQGEYQEVFKLMRSEVLAVHPWAKPLLEVICVQTGICAFPNYTKCPIQPKTVKVLDSKIDQIREKWEKTNHRANPVAKNGRTM